MSASTSTQPDLSDLQLRGFHRLFMGDDVIVSTTGGMVYLATEERRGGRMARASLTATQADELARDLQAYAEAARRESR